MGTGGRSLPSKEGDIHYFIRKTNIIHSYIFFKYITYNILMYQGNARYSCAVLQVFASFVSSIVQSL